MSNTCAQIRDALREGREVSDSESAAHVAGCPACAALIETAAPLRAALGGEPASEAPAGLELAYAGIQARIDHEDAGLGGFLRGRSTRVRVALALISAALIVIPNAVLAGRSDLAVYPRARMVLTIVAMSTALVVTMLVALRPAHRPAVSQRTVNAFVVLGLLLQLVLSTVPAYDAPQASHGEGGVQLLVQAMPCLLFGLVLGFPVYAIVRVLDHQVTRVAALLAGGSAGLTGNLALHLHCSNANPEHILVGHFSVAVIFVALVSFGSLWLSGRWSTQPR